MNFTDSNCQDLYGGFEVPVTNKAVGCEWD